MDRREAVLAAFFRAVLAGQIDRDVILGAFDGPTLQGVCGMARPGECQPSVAEKVRILGSLVAHGSLGAALRVGRWAGDWSRRDPRNEHWHLGPVAVDRHLQGRGMGGAMLEAFCERMDQEGAMAYLETDKRENIGFYEEYSFRVVGESAVWGQANWYLSRQAK